MTERRGTILPFYVVADESASMAPHIQDLNAGLVSLYEALMSEPMAAAKVRLSILGFSDGVIRRVRLVDIRADLAIPTFEARGTTNYGAVFLYLHAIIPDDISLLKNEGYSVHRPAVFFLSDGLPSDGEGWREPYSSLMAEAFRPNIVSFGIGNAAPETILATASDNGLAYMNVDAPDIGSAISAFTDSLTKSVVASAHSIIAGRPELVVDAPEGFRMAIDVI